MVIANFVVEVPPTAELTSCPKFAVLEMYKYCPSTAVWYCPDAETDTDCQLELFACAFQVAP